MNNLPSSRPLAVLIGGNGFLGHHTAATLIKRGWRVRLASRHPNTAAFTTYGDACSFHTTDCRNAAEVTAALQGADAVVNLTGILAPTAQQSFDQVHHQGAAIAAAAARQANIKKFVQVSAIGADAASPSTYARSKATGEVAVLQTLPDAIILRPSIIFGPEDSFFNRFAGMARFAPALPLIGGGATLFQPVYVDDVAEAIARAIDGQAKAGTIYELGGPEQRSFADLLRYILTTTGMRRALLPLPFPLAMLVALGMETADTLSHHHLPAMLMITRDQVKLLRTDNVVSANALQQGRTLQGLGIIPTALEAIVPGYLGKAKT